MSKRRAIFEDVSGRPAAAAPPPAAGAAEATRARHRRQTAIWVFVLAAMVAAMVLVGGLTRLTDSGLSITEWRPVTGALPPMSAEAWQAEFDKYRAIPEYRLQNAGMSLDEFKVIYWWEWGHRQLGRAVGLVWALGFFGLLALRRIPPGWTGRLLLPGVLGGVQGAIGWWMVSSGLTGTMLDVASYRLATHLGLAFVILGLLLHAGFQLSRPAAALLQARRRRVAGPRRVGIAVTGLLFLQIVAGALVAGIDAGRAYNEWPLMGGAFVPAGLWDLAPWYANFADNPATVQFAHRILAYLLLAAMVVWLIAARRGGNPATLRRVGLAAAMTLAQTILGIATVLAAAPLEWAIAHQAGGVLLWALTLRALFETGWPAEQRIARGPAATRPARRGG